MKTINKSQKNKPFWYKDFFQKFYLKIYRDILPCLDTKKEVDFIEKILKLPPGSEILDLCGGYGRHSVPLAERRLKVYLLDLNKNFLKKAKEEAEKQKIKIHTIHSDLRKIPFSNKFDAVINIFNSFGYLENDEENEKAIKAIVKSLKPNGLFLIDIINGDWLKNNSRPESQRQTGNLSIIESVKFNSETKINIVSLKIINTKNHKIQYASQALRLYSFNDLKKLLTNNGLKIIEKYGGFNEEKFSPKLSKRIILLTKKEK